MTRFYQLHGPCDQVPPRELFHFLDSRLGCPWGCIGEVQPVTGLSTKTGNERAFPRRDNIHADLRGTHAMTERIPQPSICSILSAFPISCPRRSTWWLQWPLCWLIPLHCPDRAIHLQTLSCSVIRHTPAAARPPFLPPSSFGNKSPRRILRTCT